MPSSPLKFACKTHKGLVRKRNEDYMAILAEQGLVAVADGMGGQASGHFASKMAVDETIRGLLPVQGQSDLSEAECHEQMRKVITEANKKIYAAATEQKDLNGMGTTLVVALFREDKIHFAHVGDSRLYRMRAGRLTPMTRDHSLVQEMVDEGAYRNRGEAMASGIGNNVLTRGLGGKPDVTVDISSATCRLGDIYLFCTDGLAGRVPDGEISACMLYAAGNVDKLAEDLLQAALDKGGVDNVSLVVCYPILE